MYTQFYNFTENPFNLNPDPKFLYLSPSHREALASMIYGINERKGFISITGEVGVGKTTLIYTLLNNLNEKVKTAFIYHTTVTFEQLLAYILIDLNGSVEGKEDKTSLLHQLSHYLNQNISQDETLAIIIDEAQNLPNNVMEEFRLLSNVETSKQKLLQILLVGQPELEAKLNSNELRQLKQRISIGRTIKPLNQKERKEYINHRLNTVGSCSAEVFTSDAISLICKHSEGIPRVINVIADNALLIGYSLSKKKITAKIINEVIDDLHNRTVKTPSSSMIETTTLPPQKNVISKRLRFFLISCAVVICLVALAILNRGGVNDRSDPEKVIQLTEIAPDPPTIADPQQKIQEQPSPREVLQKETPEQAFAERKPVQETPVTPKVLVIKKILLKDGGTLYSIALKTYKKANTTLYDLILSANPEITDLRTIPDNQEIILPKITRESFIEESSAKTYFIYLGTFETSEEAQSYSGKVTDLGKEITRKTHKFSSKDTWHRVTIGTYTSQKEALKTVDLLVERGLIYIP